ncbi:MAG: hypothetical protein IPJ85_10905 [Flavobacteriales bacterium]|nr:hypothetical protein [Flavobacteriales bacterium]
MLWRKRPTPDLTLQDMAWSSGTHHYGVTQKILSPSTPALPMDISGTADAEFVSGTEVRLRPGFHAGGFASETEGRFRARIDQTLGPVGDVIIISPAPNGSEPYGSIVDNVIHVHKWEKVEVGLRLPQEYQDAIDGFFARYYLNGVNSEATPGNVDAVHDLNPYADDSLQLVMTLTRPDGSQTMKWGFYMVEATWTGEEDNALVTAAVPASNTLVPYNVRFRFSPDMEGAWQFSLSISAPNTLNQGNMPLATMQLSGYAFHCTTPFLATTGTCK